MNQYETYKKYYEQVDFSPVFRVMNFKFRQVRILLSNGNWVIVRDKINNIADLKKNILKLFNEEKKVYPAKIYYMVSRFLNPEKARYREGCRGISKGFVVADNCFIKQDDIVFDIDENPVKNVKKLIKWLENKYKVNYILFSGKRGVHVSIKRELECNVSNPKEREKWYLEQNKELVNEIKAVGIDIDGIVSNTRQIVKVPLTLSDNKICMFLTPKGLESSVKTLIKSDEKGRPDDITRRTGRTEPRPSPNNYLGVFSSVNGCRDSYHVFLEFRSRTKEQVKRTIKEAIERFHLSEFYLFEKESIFAISLTLVSKRRYEKILKFTKSMMLSKLLKYNETHIPHDLEFIEKIDSQYTSTSSRGFYEFIRSFGLEPKVRDFCGKEDVSIGEFKVR
jgi:hypothetical protein